MTIPLRNARCRRLFAADAFAVNDLLVVQASTQTVSQLAGAGWLFELAPRDAHVLGYLAAASNVSAVLPSYSMWLLATHSVAQPNSAVSRHRRLWNSFAASGLELPTSSRSDEFEIATEGGLRWCGAVELRGPRDLRFASKVIEAEAACAVIAVDARYAEQLSGLLKQGWTFERGTPSREILDWLRHRGGLLCFPVGAFDDGEAGVALLGEPSVVTRLHSLNHR